MPDGATCPHCSTTRLIRREALPRAPRLGDGLALYLRFRLRRLPAPIRCRHYVCELCGHTWHTYETAE